MIPIPLNWESLPRRAFGRAAAVPIPQNWKDLPRKPFRVKFLSLAQLLHTHRSPTQFAYRFEIWWFGCPSKAERPMHYTVKAITVDDVRPRVEREDIFSKEIDVVFWREAGVMQFYSTKSYVSAVYQHQHKRNMMAEKIFDAGSMIISLN